VHTRGYEDNAKEERPSSVIMGIWERVEEKRSGARSVGGKARGQKGAQHCRKGGNVWACEKGVEDCLKVATPRASRVFGRGKAETMTNGECIANGFYVCISNGSGSVRIMEACKDDVPANEKGKSLVPAVLKRECNVREGLEGLIEGASCWVWGREAVVNRLRDTLHAERRICLGIGDGKEVSEIKGIAWARYRRHCVLTGTGIEIEVMALKRGRCGSRNDEETRRPMMECRVGA
jgi:hypothetical protein